MNPTSSLLLILSTIYKNLYDFWYFYIDNTEHITIMFVTSFFFLKAPQEPQFGERKQKAIRILTQNICFTWVCTSKTLYLVSLFLEDFLQVSIWMLLLCLHISIQIPPHRWHLLEVLKSIPIHLFFSTLISLLYSTYPSLILYYVSIFVCLLSISLTRMEVTWSQRIFSFIFWINY